MNVAFFGTSDRSIPILETLKNSDFNLVLCVTKDDVKVGRKQELKSTAVKQWAEQNRVQVITITKLNTETRALIVGAMKATKIDLGVIADFSFIIPEEIFNFPAHKVVNIHFSLLPNYRGASPIQFAILNQDKTAGISYMITTKGMDGGPIIFQIPYPLSGTETSGELYKTLFEIAADKLPKVLKDYVSGKLIPKEQDHKKATYTYSPSPPNHTFIYKEDAKIDWQKSPAEIDSIVRAFNPWPIAWSTLGELRKAKTPIYNNYDNSPDAAVTGTELTQDNGGNSSRNDNKRIKIYETAVINNGTQDELQIKKIQVEGKNILSWEEFKNGYLS